MTVILAVSPELAAHLGTAIRAHRRTFQTMGVSTPPELARLEEHLAHVARGGLERTTLEQLQALPDAAAMPPQLLTYGQAARVLACAERTVRRLVASGALPAVRIGTSPRIRTADLDTYVTDTLEG